MARRTAASTSARLVIFPAIAVTAPGARLSFGSIQPIADSSSKARMLAPSLAKAPTMARPTGPPAPVTKAVRPVSDTPSAPFAGRVPLREASENFHQAGPRPGDVADHQCGGRLRRPATQQGNQLLVLGHGLVRIRNSPIEVEARKLKVASQSSDGVEQEAVAGGSGDRLVKDGILGREGRELLVGFAASRLAHGGRRLLELSKVLFSDIARRQARCLWLKEESHIVQLVE